MSSDRAFEAPDLIEVMDEAVKYNGYLIDELVRWSRGLASVLDFGAGNGRFARALHEGRVNIHIVEPDPELRAKADPGIPVYESLEALGEQRFEGIYSINVLEHLEEDQAFLNSFYERLAPGGRLFIYVPAFQLLFSANDERVGHFRRYRMRPLVEMIENAGFDVVRSNYVDSVGFVAGLGYRFFGDPDGDLSVGAVRLYDRIVFPLSRLLDRGLGQLLGKNLLVCAVRPETR